MAQQAARRGGPRHLPVLIARVDVQQAAPRRECPAGGGLARARPAEQHEQLARPPVADGLVILPSDRRFVEAVRSGVLFIGALYEQCAYE